MKKLIFDIETIGEDFDSFDSLTQDSLTRWIKKESQGQNEYQSALEDLKNGLGFSPLTGEIVVIGVLDSQTEKGAVYFQAPNSGIVAFEEGGVKFQPMSEGEMLIKLWELAEKYDEFVSFNGRSFDVPFLAVRSAINKIRPSKDLSSNRYLRSQNTRARHIDLLDQLSFYGASRRKGNLHLWCRAFGIKSPKADGMTGDDVGRLFSEKRFEEIARYNRDDLMATKKLFDYWDKYLNFQ